MDNRPRVLRRIASMDRAELADRLRQSFQRRIDSFIYGLGFDPSRSELRPGVIFPRKFFFNGQDVAGRLDLIRRRMPQQAALIVKRAEDICQHRFDLLGYENLDYGQEIDWHWDRVHRKRAPRSVWRRLRYLDFSSVGDAKITWELNRHQHLVNLAKAYRLTDDSRFATELVSQWQHWQRENRYPSGINWTSTLEVAFRSLSWLWIYFLLQETPALTPEFREEWIRAIARNGRFLERYLSTYFSPNTHLLGEAVAIFFIGTLCPELRSSERWKRKGWELLLRESERQVRADGFYFEQSTYYHVYALDFLLHAQILASLNGMPFPVEFDRRLERMLDVLEVLCRAGAPPRWGDDDGGRVFDPSRNRAEHLLDPLAIGTVLFGRGDYKFLVGELREETLWLFGKEGAATFDRIEAKEPAMNSVAFPEAGLYIMSSSGRKLQAVIDAGPQGALSAGHGHADALSVIVHAGNRELLGDPGTCVYVGAGTERDQFRGTAAHNTVQLDGRNQSEPNGPFGWKSLTKAKVETWICSETFDLFVGSHDSYSQPENQAIHRRWVFFRKGKFWMVRDVMLGTGKHQLDVCWHLNPELSLSKPLGRPFFLSEKENGIGIFALNDETWSETVQRGLWSPVYGRKEPATEVRFTTVNNLPAEFATLLVPVDHVAKSSGATARLTQISVSPELSAYRITDTLGEHCFLFSQGRSWKFDEWKSDSEFLYCCSIGGKLNYMAFCNGTDVEYRGTKIVSSTRRVLRCEISHLHGKPQVFSSDSGILVSQEGWIKSFEAGETVPLEQDEAGH